jgi:hypothetical protein
MGGFGVNKQMNLDDLDHNEIIYPHGSLTFRELLRKNGKDKGRIVEIIRNCAVKSTAILFTDFFLHPEEIEEDIKKNHKHLDSLLVEFKNMKNEYSYIEKSEIKIISVKYGNM